MSNQLFSRRTTRYIKPKDRYILLVSQSIPDSTPTAIKFDGLPTVTTIPGITYNPVDGQFTCQKRGVYMIRAIYVTVASATGVRECYISKGGVNVDRYGHRYASILSPIRNSVESVAAVPLDVGDVFYFTVFQNTGPPYPAEGVSFDPNLYCQLEIVEI